MRLLSFLVLWFACSITARYVQDFHDLQVGETAQVFSKGSGAKCIFGQPYQFQIRKGDLDKLLIYFQGGGVCYDEQSTLDKNCPAVFIPGQLQGMLMPNETSHSKFHDFSIVVVNYCSGDLHVGSKKQPYRGPNGERVEQQGIKNFINVLHWIRRQQAEGAIASSVAELVIVGASAGSYPAMLLTHEIAARIKYERAAVFLDSMEIITPPGVLRYMFNNFDQCKVFRFFVSLDAVARCYNDPEFEMIDFFRELASKTPDIPYAFTVSKLDYAQISFYNKLLKVADPPSRNYIGKQGVVNKMYHLFTPYLESIPNVVMYLINGPSHVFINRPHFFTTDATGAEGRSRQSGFKGPSYQEWLESMPLRNVGDKIKSVCYGPVKDEILDIDYNGTGNNDTLNYCLRSVIDKEYVQQPQKLQRIRW